MITGDFNLPIVKWVENEESGDFIPIIGESEGAEATIARHVTDSMIQLGLSQMNNIQNASRNVLDLIYTNVPELTVMEKADRLLIPKECSDKAHNPLSMFVECNPNIFPTTDNRFAAYSFRKGNYTAMREHFDNFDHSRIYQCMDVNTMLDEFYDMIYKAFELFVPKATIKPSSHPTWYNKKLCNLRNATNRKYGKLCAARKLNENADSSAYDKSCKEFEKVKLEEYNNFVHNLASNARKQPGKFWKFINGKRKSNSLPGKVMYNDKTATNDSEKANLFAEFFGSVFIKRPADPELDDFINERNDDGLFEIHITPIMVEKALTTIDLSKGQGPDLIPPIVLRECAKSLAVPLSFIFEKSIDDGIYPDKFKLSQITAIYKSGKKTDVKNYRGVAVMPNLAKMFERVVYEQAKLIICPQISKKAHGFVSNRSVETNLMEFSHYVHTAFEIGAQVDSFYSDVSKAFDTVDQPKSIRKLANFRFGNRSLRWFNSYSSGRKHRVKIGSEVSEEFDADSAIG